jgi:hypothetical protein
MIPSFAVMLETSANSRFLMLCGWLNHSFVDRSCTPYLYLFSVRSNALSIVWAIRNADVKTLQLFAAAGKAHFQFEAILVLEVLLEVLAGAIERNESRHFGRQALLDISRFQHCATHGDGAVFGRNGEPYRRQRTRSAIGANTAVDADAHIAPWRSLDFPVYGIVLAVNSAGTAQQNRRGRPSSSNDITSCARARPELKAMARQRLEIAPMMLPLSIQLGEVFLRNSASAFSG